MIIGPVDSSPGESVRADCRVPWLRWEEAAGGLVRCQTWDEKDEEVLYTM